MKSKKKKIKKVLGIPVQFDLGEKIKDIEIDINKYKVFNLILLIALNVCLVLTLTYFMTIITNTLVIIISLFTIIVCIIWSILSYRTNVVKIKYSIYKNAVVKDFDTSVNVGELSKLIGFKIRNSLIDKCGKHATKTITLKFLNPWCPRISLSCITEDAEPLIDLIIDLSQTVRANEKTKHSKKHINFLQKVLKDAPIQSKITQETNIEKLKADQKQITLDDTDITK